MELLVVNSNPFIVVRAGKDWARMLVTTCELCGSPNCSRIVEILLNHLSRYVVYLVLIESSYGGYGSCVKL